MLNVGVSVYNRRWMTPVYIECMFYDFTLTTYSVYSKIVCVDKASMTPTNLSFFSLSLKDKRDKEFNPINVDHVEKTKTCIHYWPSSTLVSPPLIISKI